MMERIKEAAICQGERIWTGRRHGDVIVAMVEEGEYQRPVRQDQQGFVTDTGRFVSRAEAFEIAVQAGQVKEPGPGKARRLLSEDLY